MSGNVRWSVESLPSNPAARFRFPAGTGILIFKNTLGVCLRYNVIVLFCGYTKTIQHFINGETVTWTTLLCLRLRAS